MDVDWKKWQDTAPLVKYCNLTTTTKPRRRFSIATDIRKGEIQCELSKGPVPSGAFISASWNWLLRCWFLARLWRQVVLYSKSHQASLRDCARLRSLSGKRNMRNWILLVLAVGRPTRFRLSTQRHCTVCTQPHFKLNRRRDV
jgi:hypothetical protein